jgi:hypothetical protein
VVAAKRETTGYPFGDALSTPEGVAYQIQGGVNLLRDRCRGPIPRALV